MTEIIKDFYNRVIGRIETKANGDKIGKDFYNRIVGYYEKSSNLTKDFYRRVVSKGDTLVALIYAAEEKNKQK